LNKKLKIITLLVITGLMALNLVSFAKSAGPPLLPMTIQGYVTIQKGDGTNMTAPNLTVYAKVQNTTIPNNAQTVGLTDDQGKYTLSVGSSDNTVPPEGTPIDIWVQNINVTRTILHYQTFLPDLNLTVVDTTSPTIQVLWPTPNSIVTSSQPLWVNATVTDDLLINETSMEMTLNQTQLAWTFDNATGLLSNQTGPPTPGTYVANITVSDIAGNTAVETWSFMAKNVTAPAVTITSPTTANQAYARSGKSVQVVFTYIEPNPLNWTVVISNAAHTVPSVSNGTAITPGSGTVTASVVIDQSATDGLYNVAVTMYNTDVLGNTTTQTNAVMIDNTPPTIGTPTQVPLNSSGVQPTDTVNVSVSVTDTGSGVYNVTLGYNNGTWYEVTMTLTSGLWQASIPPQSAGTTVQYNITAYDKAGNKAVNDNAGAYYIYNVMPEFPTVTVLIALMASTAILTVLVKKRKTFKT
jgi:hypothetical protein